MLPAQPHHITARLHGGRKTGTPVDIPILPELQAAIDAMLQSVHLTFVVTEQGRPFTSASFGDWFWGVCQEAGISKNLSAHDLRKATRLADPRMHRS
jgi:hypothetical protein